MRALYKLGGSLLEDAGFVPRLASFLTQEARRSAEQGTPFEPMIVVGGGRTADLVRGWDQRFQLGDEPAHWLALASLALNERLLEALFINARIVYDEDDLYATWQQALVPILQTETWVHHFELLAEEPDPADILLPHNWNVTSDTIALWLADKLEATEFHLIKSCEPAEGEKFSLESISQADMVDPTFQDMWQQIHAPRSGMESKRIVLWWNNLKTGNISRMSAL
jgi:aspartokinase-like uncharacterized kinase